MATHLRLHRDDAPEPEVDAPATYQVPSAMATARRTLVAATVRVPATPDDRWDAQPQIIARFGSRPAAPSTDDIIRDVERTLERMQSRMDELREDCDRVFKFPDLSENDGPRAA